MNKPKNIFSIAAFFLVCLLCSANSFAQTENQPKQAEPNYEIVLHVLTASNNATDKSIVPPTLSGVVKKLKNTYSFSNYSLTSTYFGRIANTGAFDFKGVSSAGYTNQDNYAPIFSEWTINGLRNAPNAQGQNIVQFSNFRFGQRIPLRYSSPKNERGQTDSPLSYESIGLTMQKFSLPENVPTIVGSLSSVKSDELLFVILTVKPAE